MISNKKLLSPAGLELYQAAKAIVSFAVQDLS
jgi:hypothetical protein